MTNATTAITKFVLPTMLAISLGLPGTVLAQAEKPVAKADAQAPKLEQGRGSRADVDARECLKYSTNMEIHRCAEKYRPHKSAT